MAVDVTSSFILSGSDDSNLHLWSLPYLVSFSAIPDKSGQDTRFSPYCTLTSHKTAVTDVKFGHKPYQDNIAVSISCDKSCVVWDYMNGNVLRTFLLSVTPICLALDPVDRAAYVGLEDGSIHLINFYKEPSLTHPLWSEEQHSVTVQPDESDRWKLSKDGPVSAVECIAVSYDSITILSGHSDGKVYPWKVGLGKASDELIDLAAPVTNIVMLPPTGFLNAEQPPLKLIHVTKPRYENSSSKLMKSGMPEDYSINVQIMPRPKKRWLFDEPRETVFEAVMSDRGLPAHMILEAFASIKQHSNASELEDSEAGVALREKNEAMERESVQLKQEIRDMNAKAARRQQDDEVKAARKRKRREREAALDEIERMKEMGEQVDENGDAEMRNADLDESDLSSDTDEITDHD